MADFSSIWHQVLRLNPGNANAYPNQGNVLTDQGRLAEAEVAYRGASHLDRGDTWTYINMGTVPGDQGRLAQAEAIRLDPNDAFAYTN